jgi:hypothetical protein
VISLTWVWPSNIKHLLFHLNSELRILWDECALMIQLQYDMSKHSIKLISSYL